MKLKNNVYVIALHKMSGLCGEMVPINWERKIGKGTYGSIYESSRSSDYVAKVAFTTEVCRNYSNEFKLHHDAFDALALYNTDDVYIPFPMGMGYSVNKKCCYYEMPRLYDPFDSKCGKIVQCLLGIDMPNHYQCDDTGQHMGPRRLLNEVGAKTLERLCYNMGKIYAIIQYGSKQTAYDVEMILAKIKGHVKLCAIDYDKSESFDKFDAKILGKSLVNGYFPASQQNLEGDYVTSGMRNMYQVAAAGYVNTAADYDLEEIAEKSLAIYERYA